MIQAVRPAGRRLGYVVAVALILAAPQALAALPECHSEPMTIDCFDSYSVELKSIHYQQLDDIAYEVKERADINSRVDYIIVRGHAATWLPSDPTEQNALDRANRVFEALRDRIRARGIDPDKIVFKVSSAADSEPRVPNSTQQGRALNRRVEIKLSAPTGIIEPIWLSDFEVCKEPYPPYPDLRWLDNKTLERIRNQEPPGTRTLARGNDNTEANRLLNTFLARWSCELFKRNLLHPSSAGSPFSPGENYNERTVELVKHFQNATGGARTPGTVDLATLQAMDRWLGIREPGAKNPKRRGAPKDDLEIEGTSIANLTNVEGSVVAQIFFPTNGADLEEDDVRALQSVADFFEAQGATKVRFKVLGFADSRDRASFNDLLGDERVASVEGKLRELLTAKKIWNRSVIPPFFMGEVERPQIGESADDLRRFRRADVVLTEFGTDSCWDCTLEEWENGVKNGRRACNLLCPVKQTPPKVCDPDETAEDWEIRGQISGFCRSVVKDPKGATGVGACVMTGDLWLKGGPTNKGRFCRTQYAFKAAGAGAAPNVPILCELAVTKLSPRTFSTPKRVSFSDYEGDVVFSSSGLEVGVGFTKSTMRFVEAGAKRGITPAPKAIWDWGLSSGGLSCGVSEVHGSLEMLHVPFQR